MHAWCCKPSCPPPALSQRLGRVGGAWNDLCFQPGWGQRLPGGPAQRLSVLLEFIFLRGFERLQGSSSWN